MAKFLGDITGVSGLAEPVPLYGTYIPAYRGGRGVGVPPVCVALHKVVSQTSVRCKTLCMTYKCWLLSLLSLLSLYTLSPL